MIIQKIIILKNLMKNKIKLSNSSLLPIILSQLDINVTDTSSTITHLSYSVFLLSLIALLCFIIIMNYTFIYIIIQRGNYESKYPKLSSYINYYKNKKVNLIFIAILIILCLICLLIIVIFSLLYVLASIGKT